MSDLCLLEARWERSRSQSNLFGFQWVTFAFWKFVGNGQDHNQICSASNEWPLPTGGSMGTVKITIKFVRLLMSDILLLDVRWELQIEGNLWNTHADDKVSLCNRLAKFYCVQIGGIIGYFSPFQMLKLYLHVKPYSTCMKGHFLRTYGCLVH